MAPGHAAPSAPDRTAWPRISVVLPNYNHCHFLKISLPALLNQSYPPYEIVVVDDGSKDDSVAYIEAMREKHPLIRLYRHEKNQGVVATLNTGIREITGDAMYMAAADDEVFPGFFEEAARMLAAHPETGFFCSDGEIYHELEKRTEIRLLELADQPAYLSPKAFLRRIRQLPYFYFESHTLITSCKVFDKSEALDPRLGYRADWFFNWVNVARHGCCYSPRNLARFLDRGNNFSLATARNVPADTEIWRRVMAKLRNPAYEKVWPFILNASQYSGDRGMIQRILLVLAEDRANWKMISWSLIRAWLREQFHYVFGYLRRNLTPARIRDDLFNAARWALWRVSWTGVSLLGRIFPTRANSLRQAAMRLLGAQVADDCWVDPSAWFSRPWKLHLDQQVRIGARVKINSLFRISIGSHTIIAEDVTFPQTPPTTIPFSPRAPIVIGENCRIGTRAQIFAGSNVPPNTQVPAEAVVTHEGITVLR